MKTIDMRSDTVTHPTDEMRKAMAGAAVGDDVYGDDQTTIELECLAAEMSGMESALFVPSGTFGNQLALFTHCRRGDEVILYDDCHIVWHEAAASAIIAGVQLRTLSGAGSEPDAALIESRIRVGVAEDIHKPATGLICLENAHSNGRVISLPRMAAVREVSKKYGVPVHLDGARLFNAAGYLNADVREICKHVDSVMFCLSKGMCAPVGSILAGSAAFIDSARRKRKLMGGGMRQTGILAAAGIIALRDMSKRLVDDRKTAVRLAEGLAGLDGITARPDEVHINLVFLGLASERLGERIMAAFDKNGILANAPENNEMRLATHFYIDEKDVDFVVKTVAEACKNA